MSFGLTLLLFFLSCLRAVRRPSKYSTTLKSRVFYVFNLNLSSLYQMSYLVHAFIMLCVPDIRLIVNKFDYRSK